VRTVQVPLGDRRYPIRIGTGLLRQLGPQCARLRLGSSCAIVTDENIAKKYLRPATASLRATGFTTAALTMPAGEKAKSLKNVQAAYDQLAAHRLERSSFIVALGGGVVGDLAGFLAATYLRGITFVQVPTTLLAQVDSSVGGKVGVNLTAGKNLVGAFHQPRLVLCDLDTLRTLPSREFRAGLAEIIKYGIIRDARLFARLERDMEKLLKQHSNTLAPVIARCCSIKAEVVAADEREGSLRAILNFGHTIGHALEAISRYGQYLHGEAISIGQAAAARISAEIAGLPTASVGRIENLLNQAKLPTRVHLKEPQTRRLLDAMRLDKKVTDGKINFVLAQTIGQVKRDQIVPPSLIRQSLNPKPLTTRLSRGR